MKARSTSVEATYQGVDITDDIAKDLLSFEYIDNASGESDSVSIALKDDKHIWLEDWFPQKGDKVIPKILTKNWNSPGDNNSLPCGTFIVDEPTYSGRPSTFTLNGISSPLNKDFTDTDKSKVWKNINLESIAGDIAGRAGISLQFLSSNNPLYEVKEQSETTDSSFLSSLCEDEGLSMKVTDEKIVIFDEDEYESRPAVATYKESNDNVLAYDFKTQLADTGYTGIKVEYYDTKKEELIEYTHTTGVDNDEEKVYKVNNRVENKAEAIRIAEKTARKLNKKETTGSLSVVGNLELLGGVNINLQGFGAFSGKYFIEKASHSISGGYTTGIEVRKVLGG